MDSHTISDTPHRITGGSERGFPTHIFGGTLVPAWIMPAFYAPLGRRLSEGGPIAYHRMAPLGGLGRTDRIVESYTPFLDKARSEKTAVRLAGHSLGGVVAWVLAHEYPDVVDTVELWAAPVRGTALAALLRNVVAEARFLAPGSPWLDRYDRALNGPIARSVYTACDVLVAPPRASSFIDGDRAQNHFLCPRPLTRRERRAGEQIHTGWADHTLLPRHRSLLARVA
jgi:pimeloyl-ACP methyl ester carboxylesterase